MTAEKSEQQLILILETHASFRMMYDLLLSELYEKQENRSKLTIIWVIPLFSDVVVKAIF